MPRRPRPAFAPSPARTPFVLLALATAMALVAAGCGGDKKAAKPKVPITTSTAPTTTAVPPPGFPAGAAPLTALPAKPELLHRPVLVVKIDNAPKARPQSGLLQADIVVEEKVEDGVTRFFTMFQSQDAGAVGPVRSARSTDITLVTPLNRPLFAYSGTNATFQKLISAAPLVDVGVNAAAGEYHREGGRPAPYNLFSTTPGLFGHAPAGAGAPPPVFAYRPAGQPSANASATPLGHVHIEYKGVHVTTVVDWTWDPAAQSWLRAQDGGPHKDSAGAQVSAKNVVVQFVDYVDTGQRDRSNTVVPEGKLIGTGEAWVFTDGKLVKGTWSKPTPEAVTSYVDPAGAPIGLTPGQTWVELPPPGSAAV